MQTKTELHTHLMGMLSAKSFIGFLSKYGYCFPINDDGEIDFKNTKVKRVPAINLFNDKKILKQLSIPHDEKTEYKYLNDFYIVRNTLMADLIEHLQEVQNKFVNPNLKYAVYGFYLEECLRELISQEVEYVEISFSNAPIIENSIKYVNPAIFEKIKCKFLLSTDRSKIAKDFRQSSNHMLDLVEKGFSVGFDVMGAEVPLTDLDMDRISKFGLEQKLTPVVQKLNKWKNTTLRIHSGETRYSSDNVQKVLTVIERIERELKITVPPPAIRIGHGIYFRESEEYLRLLKKFNCIIEINASSNYALNNIDDYNDIPYDYYLDNDIDVVICSDGHGLYDTNKEKEDNIASSNVTKDNITKIVETDKKIRKEK